MQSAAPFVQKWMAYGDGAHANQATFSWGHAFYDEDNPLCHAANHAVVLDGKALDHAIVDIRRFYAKLDMPPRLCISLPEAEMQVPLLTLENAGFTASVCDAVACVWQGETPPEVPELPIRRVRSLFGEAMDFALSALEIWGAKALKKRLRMGEDCRLFMAFPPEDGQAADFPAAMAVLRSFEWQGQRLHAIEDVYTDPAWRGKGFATALVQHLIYLYHRQALVGPLVLCARQELARQLYQPLGFVPLGGLPMRVWASYEGAACAQRDVGGVL